MILIGNLGEPNNMFDILPKKDDVKSIGHVYAAIAYGSVQNRPGFIENCDDNKLDVSLWMRFDHTVPVSKELLKKLIGIANIKCQFVHDDLHSKIIWWKGYGVYIGSANLTDKAWNRGIETGLFLSNQEIIENSLTLQLKEYFEKLKKINGNFPLSEEFIGKVRELTKLKKEWEQKAKQVRKLSNWAKLENKEHTAINKFVAYIGTDHYKNGHFNVNSKFKKLFGQNDENILITTSELDITGNINRNAQRNSSPRICGYEGLRKWYHENDLLGRKINVNVINSNEIFISKYSFSYSNLDRKKFKFKSVDALEKMSYLSANELIAFNSIHEILNFLSISQKNTKVDSLSIVKANGKVIWFPFLFADNNWENLLSPNNKTIIARPLLIDKDISKRIKAENQERIVFTVEKDKDNEVIIIYRGQFRLDTNVNNFDNGFVFRKVNSKFDLLNDVK